MKLTTPFSVIKNAMSDIKRMHDFNYTLPKENYWDNECKEHPTNSHCFGLLWLIQEGDNPLFLCYNIIDCIEIWIIF